jgi:hypothetical protein
MAKKTTLQPICRNPFHVGPASIEGRSPFEPFPQSSQQLLEGAWRRPLDPDDICSLLRHGWVPGAGKELRERILRVRGGGRIVATTEGMNPTQFIQINNRHLRRLDKLLENRQLAPPAGVHRSTKPRILAACFASGCSGGLFGCPSGRGRIVGSQNRVEPRLVPRRGRGRPARTPRSQAQSSRRSRYAL